MKKLLVILLGVATITMMGCGKTEETEKEEVQTFESIEEFERYEYEKWIEEKHSDPEYMKWREEEVEKMMNDPHYFDYKPLSPSLE